VLVGVSCTFIWGVKVKLVRPYVKAGGTSLTAIEILAEVLPLELLALTV
jgi:hypothetical protein